MNKEEKENELFALSREIAARDAKIVAEHKRLHKLSSRGAIDTPQRRALQKEEKQRIIAIREKYK